MGLLDLVLVVVTLVACALAWTLWRQRGDADVEMTEPDLTLIAAMGGETGSGA